MARAFIALGGNLSKPGRQPADEIKLALRELDTLTDTRVLGHSSLYRTAPVGYDNQPDFINAVAEVETSLSPLALLHAILALETQHGRVRPFPNAPRILDLDLLLYDQVTMNSPELTLPHPRMHERGFVLLPLAEIAPTLALAAHGEVSTLARQCADQGVERLEENAA